MARDLTAGFIAEIDAKQLRLEILVALDFDSDPFFAWTGIGPVTWNGDIYTGVGDLASFGRMEESSVVKANGTTLYLSGVKSSLLSIALQSNYQGRKGRIYVAVMDSSNAIIADPYLLFAGRMDVMEIEDNGIEGKIGVSIENELIDLFKPKNSYYMPEDQKAKFPGDLGLDFIPLIQDREVIWKEKA